MKTMKKQLRLAVFTAIIAILPSSAQAMVVSGPDILPDFQFNNPGARSNAMGGAFIGVADDATAAFANPAGLTILTRAESSIEFKNSLHTSQIYLENGQKYEFDHASFGTSFIGYAAPKGKNAIALYRHELVNLSEKVDKISYTPNITTRLVNSELDIKAITYGAAFAAKLLNSLSAGFSVGFTSMDYYYLSDYTVATNQSSFGTNSRVNSTASAENYTASILYSPAGFLNIGAVYRYGPEFDTTYIDSSGNEVKNVINVPDIYGLGISLRIGSDLTIACDVNRVMYSDLVDDFYFFDSTLVGTKNPWVRNGSQFQVNDTTEVHVGFEYILDLAGTPVALRGGYFNKPDHTIHYTETRLTYLTKFRQGDDDNIYSAGIGTVIGENGQIDLAASIGDQVEEYVLSMVYRF